MIPREGENMGKPPGTPNEDERKMSNGRGQENISTTAKLTQMHSTTTTINQTRGQAEVEIIVDK